MSSTAMISTGISELDQRLGGLVPGRYYLLTGTPGAGKTSACLHFLAEGLRAGDRCAVLTQENPDDLFAQAEFLGHDLRQAVAEDALALLQYRLDFSDNYARVGNPRAVATELLGLLGETRPQRLVIDSIVPFIQAGGVVHGAVNSLIQVMDELQCCALFTVPGDLGDSFYARLYDPIVSGTAGILHFEMERDDVRRISIRKIRQTPASTDPLHFVIRPGVGIVEIGGEVGVPSDGDSRRVALINEGGFLGGDLYSSLEQAYQIETFPSTESALPEVTEGFALLIVAVDPLTADKTLSFVRAVRKHSGVPLVLVADADGLRKVTRARAMRVGADEFLTLEESGQSLLARIEAARARGPRDMLQRLRPERLLLQPRDDRGRFLPLPEEEVGRAVRHHMATAEHPFFAIVRLTVPAELMGPTWHVLSQGLRLGDGDLVAHGCAGGMVLYLHDISRRHARELLGRLFASDPRFDAIDVAVEHYPADAASVNGWLAQLAAPQAVAAGG